MVAVGVRVGGFNEFEPEKALENLRVLAQWAAEGKVVPHISHNYPLEQAADAMQAIIDRQVIGKCVLTN